MTKYPGFEFRILHIITVTLIGGEVIPVAYTVILQLITD